MIKKKPYKKFQEISKSCAKEPKIKYDFIRKHSKINKTITISSLQEQEEDNRNYWCSLTPQERLNQHLFMIKHFFGIKNKKMKRIGKHIEFD